MRPLLAAAALVAFTALPQAAFALPRVGDVPPAFSIPSPDGKPVSLAGLGGKAVYLNFFANWCPPCNAEAPDVARLARKYARSGFVVLGIDELESRQKAAAFKQKFALPFRVGSDDAGEVGRAYFGGIGLPVHVFIDRRGHVSTYVLGEMTAPQIETAIKTALR